MSKKFETEIRVRYSDTDQMGVVYYANYFTWLEVARTEFLRSVGMNYKDIESRKNLALPVVEAECKYKSPARYDDIVVVGVDIAEVKNASIKFTYQLLHKASGKVLATASTKHVFIDKNRKLVKIPSEVREALGA